MTNQGSVTSLSDGLHDGVEIVPDFTSAPPLRRPQTEASPSRSHQWTVGVIIACFDVRRMDLLMKAMQSVRDQDYPNKLIIVVDHNEDLFVQVLNAAPGGVSVLRNARSRGAAGARNTGALKSDCDLVAFLDDDASAQVGWLRPLVRAMGDPGVVGAGGRILPRWQNERPRWFPDEFGWVVGASIVDDGEGSFPVRNVWSGSMIVDRRAFQHVGGFREDLSKIGKAARPEDTELCLRLSHAYGAAGQWLMVPTAMVEHYVPAHRATLRYVLTRCWAEGAGKVQLRTIAADRSRALADEKLYLSRVIPHAIGAGLVQSLRMQKIDGLLRSCTILLGVGAALVGALITAIGAAINKHAKGESV